MASRTKELALAGAARAVVVAAALVLVGLVVDGLLLGARSARALAEGSVFELLLGLFVGGPTGALERWYRVRPQPFGPGDERLDAPMLGLATLLLAWLGAGAAFLQALYAEAALSTGSTDAGLEALLTNWRWVYEPMNAGGLCGAVALTFAASAVGRRWAPDRPGQQVAISLAGPAAAGVLLVLIAGLHPASLVTLAMSTIVAVLLPLLCRAGDRLEDALRAWLGPPG